MSILIKDMEMPEKQVSVILNPNGLVEVLDTNNVLLEEYQAIPTADVRPVVLCRDCVYLTRDEYGAWCFNNYEESLKDDDFCSHGKRKEKS